VSGTRSASRIFRPWSAVCLPPSLLAVLVWSRDGCFRVHGWRRLRGKMMLLAWHAFPGLPLLQLLELSVVSSCTSVHTFTVVKGGTPVDLGTVVGSTGVTGAGVVAGGGGLVTDVVRLLWFVVAPASAGCPLYGPPSPGCRWPLALRSVEGSESSSSRPGRLFTAHPGH